MIKIDGKEYAAAWEHLSLEQAVAYIESKYTKIDFPVHPDFADFLGALPEMCEEDFSAMVALSPWGQFSEAINLDGEKRYSQLFSLYFERKPSGADVFVFVALVTALRAIWESYLKTCEAYPIKPDPKSGGKEISEMFGLDALIDLLTGNDLTKEETVRNSPAIFVVDWLKRYQMRQHFASKRAEKMKSKIKTKKK